MPNEMQLIETDGTPKHEIQKRALISNGGINRPTLTLAPMGIVAPWRCQEPQISVRARQCLHPLGDGVIIPTQNFDNWTEKSKTSLTKTDSKLKD